MSPFLAWGDFHARSRFARSTIPWEKWGTTRSLRLNERLFFFPGFLSLSSSKLIAVQPSNMLTASHVEYPMLPSKPTYESTADTQQSQGET